MSPVLGLILIFGVIIVGVYLNTKFKINLGLICMSATFIIGYIFLGLNSGKLLGYFPTRIAVTIILFCYFSGMVQRVGVFEGIAKRIFWMFRKAPALLPFAIFVAAATVNAAGGGTFAAMTVVGPIGFAVAEVAGFEPLLASVGVWAGAGIMWWWCQMSTPVILEHVGGAIGPEYGQAALVEFVVALLVLYILALVVIYIVFKGWKSNVKPEDIEKPEPFTPFQKRVLWVVLGYVVLISVPNIIQTFAPNTVTGWFSSHVDMYVLLAICNLIFTGMKIAKCETVIKDDIPWGLILMICGTSMLISLLSDFGTVDFLTNWIATSVSPFWIIPALLLIGGVLTLFSNGMTVLMVMAPMVFAVASATGIPQLGAYVATAVSGQGTSISPFSTGGALAMMNATKNMDRDALMRKQIGFTIFMLVLQVLLGVVGFFNWMRP